MKFNKYVITKMLIPTHLKRYLYKNSGKQVLPDGYIQLKYIESTGTQGIDTGITGDSTWEIKAQSTISSTSSQVLISKNVEGGNWFGAINGKWGAGGTGITNIDETTLADILLNFSGSTVSGTVNGESFERIGTISSSATYRLFSWNSYPFSGKLYKAKCVKNNQIVRNLVPALKKSNGNQLFDYTRTDGIIANKYINQAGAIVSGANEYYISYPISVTPGETYTWRFNADSYNTTHTAPTVGFYDINDNLISVAQHATAIKYFSFTVPSNCAYIRCSVFTRDNAQGQAMLNKGARPLSYESYIPDEAGMYDLSATSENLFDESTAVLGKYIDGNGVEQTSSTGENNHSDYIPIKSGAQYTLAETKPSYNGIVSSIAWYTSAKVFIQRDSATLPSLTGRTSNTWTAPSNAVYAIINFYRYPNFDGENDMLNEGTEALPYEPYQKRFYTNSGTGEFIYES